MESELTVDIKKMYHAAIAHDMLARHGMRPGLKEVMAKRLFESELDRRWGLFLEAAKKAGYTRITLGPSEHSMFSLTKGNMVFAEPNIERKNGYSFSRTPLWDGMCDILGGQVCGNGCGPKAVQAQLCLPPDAFKKYQGVHDL